MAFLGTYQVVSERPLGQTRRVGRIFIIISRIDQGAFPFFLTRQPINALVGPLCFSGTPASGLSYLAGFWQAVLAYVFVIDPTSLFAFVPISLTFDPWLWFYRGYYNDIQLANSCWFLG